MNDSPNFNTILIHQNDEGNSKNVRYLQPKSLAKDNKHKKYTMGTKLFCTCTTYKHASSILYIISKDGRKAKTKKEGRLVGTCQSTMQYREAQTFCFSTIPKIILLP